MRTAQEQFEDDKATIEASLRAYYKFVKARKVEGLTARDLFEEVGYLVHRFTLSDVRGWLGLGLNDMSRDNAISDIFDRLIDAGKIHFLKIWQDKNSRNIYDYFCFACVGKARRTFKSDKSGKLGPRMIDVHFFMDQPLAKKKNRTLFSHHIERINKAIHQRLSKSAGGSGLEMEAKLLHEFYEDAVLDKKILAGRVSKVEG